MHMADRQAAPATAFELASRQRKISVSEFFLKNRQLLGFDTPAKALVTAVKEAVDNALDACEEAGILTEISVQVRDRDGKSQVVVEDNGPGIGGDRHQARPRRAPERPVYHGSSRVDRRHQANASYGSSR
jgi:anti-sigma regulatory factor (Ser/Thr protein kinase)